MQKIVIALIALVIVVGGSGIYWFTQRNASTSNTNQTPTTTPQVEGQDLTVGTGTQAIPESIVSVLYVGMLESGTVFDSSEKSNNNKPLVFQLGNPDIVPGFQIGVNGMRVGGQRRISIPPELGYGDREIKDTSGAVVIPARSKLIFDVRLVDVKPGSTTPQQ